MALSREEQRKFEEGLTAASPAKVHEIYHALQETHTQMAHTAPLTSGDARAYDVNDVYAEVLTSVRDLLTVAGRVYYGPEA
jgi:hypothetical protein